MSEEKSTLTFYLPKELVDEVKIEAVKASMTVSELLVRSALALMENHSVDLYKAPKKKDAKVLVHLHKEDKLKIKKFIAETGIILSCLFYQAIYCYFQYKNNLELPEIKSYPKKKPGMKVAEKKPQTQPFVYNLNEEIAWELDQLCRQKGENRTTVIIQVLESVDPVKVSELVYKKFGPKKVRSSMHLPQEHEEKLRARTSDLGINISDYLNIALYLYLKEVQ